MIMGGICSARGYTGGDARGVPTCRVPYHKRLAIGTDRVK